MAKKVTKKTVTETVEDDRGRKTTIKEHAPKISNSEKKSKSNNKTKAKNRSRKKKKNTQSNFQKNEMEKKREELLIENFVGLQHAMTNMSIKFGTLSDNISKLLSIFEEAAKGFVIGDKVDDEQMLDKIDSLLDQNKTIAKGLVLMEEKVRTRMEHSDEAHQIAEESNRFSNQEIKAPERQRPMEVPKFSGMKPSVIDSPSTQRSNPIPPGSQNPQGSSTQQQVSPGQPSPPRFNESAGNSQSARPRPLPQI